MEAEKTFVGQGKPLRCNNTDVIHRVELHPCHSQQGYPQVGENFQLLLARNGHCHRSCGLRPSFYLHRDCHSTCSLFYTLHCGTNDPTNGL